MSRAELWDIEAQIADDHATTRRDRMRDRMNDPRDLVRLGDRWIDADRVPHESDVEDC